MSTKMPEEKAVMPYGEIVLSWQVPEYNVHDRSRNWYIGASLVGVLMIIFAIWTLNFLFAVIIILSTLIIVLLDGREPDVVNVVLTTEGLIYGNKFYDYDEFKDFSFLYKPVDGIKNIYFEFKNPLKMRLSFPLGNFDPLPIRKNLLKYLSEDTNRDHMPISEQLAIWLKL